MFVCRTIALWVVTYIHLAMRSQRPRCMIRADDATAALLAIVPQALADLYNAP